MIRLAGDVFVWAGRVLAYAALGCVLGTALVTPTLASSPRPAPVLTGWPAGCQSADVGDYTGVIVGRDPAHTRYVYTGRRLADDDPRWRAWGALWGTCP